jgi:hypothetical protein
MEISFFASVLPSLRGVGVSKRRTQAATLVLRLMGRCVGLKRPFTGPCIEGRAKKDIPVLGSLGSVTNSHRALANGQERHLFKELKCYEFPFYLGVLFIWNSLLMPPAVQYRRGATRTLT